MNVPARVGGSFELIVRLSARLGDQPADPASTSAWTFHGDGAICATYDRQTGPRGETKFVSQNWAMAMGMRPLGPGC